MDTLTNVSPFLALLPDDLGEDMIAFKAPKLLLCIPLPPWSTADDLDETSRLIVTDPTRSSLTWDPDMLIDGYNRFQILPRGEPIVGCRCLYAVTPGLSASAISNGTHRIGCSHEGDRNCGISLFQDPFGRSLTIARAFCEVSSQQGPVLLEHTQYFDAFDVEDKEKWPIPSEVMMQRLERVRRLRVMPAPAA